MPRLFVWLLLAAPLLLAGCVEVESSRVGISPVDPHAPVNPWLVIGPLAGGGEEPGGQPVTLTVTGTVTYERLPVTSQGLGTPVTEPARGVLVEVVHHRDIKIVFESATTDQAGNFSVTFTTDIDYFVRARAQSGTGTDLDRVLHNRTNPLIAHAIPSQVFKRSEGSRTVNLHGTHSLPQIRGGAFAVLDTIQRLRESVSGTFPAFGPVDVFWSPGNLDHPFQGASFATGSGLDGPLGNPSILLAGGSTQTPHTSDYDHYDETVIAHEWSHLLMFQFSRDNNFGGPHAGEQLIPSAAWGEGVVNAIGCGLLGVTVYRDTVGYPPGQTSVQFEFDLESGLLPGSGTGWHNEFIVSRVVWDVLDGGAGWPADTDGDPVAVDKDDFLQSLANLRTRGAPFEVAWLASFLQQLIDDSLIDTADANLLMQPYGESFPPTQGPDPFPPLLVAGAPAVSGTLDAWSGANPNPVLGVGANAVYRFEVMAQENFTITLTANVAPFAQSAHQLDLELYDLGRSLLFGLAGGLEQQSGTVQLDAGTYILRVRHRPDSENSSEPTDYLLEVQ